MIQLMNINHSLTEEHYCSANEYWSFSTAITGLLYLYLNQWIYVFFYMKNKQLI